MEKGLLLMLPIVSILHIAITGCRASIDGNANFIKTSCRATTYPPLCVQSLSPNATSIQKSPLKLAQTALSVSLDKAGSTKAFVYKLTRLNGVKGREMAAIKDCSQEAGDSVDRLRNSVNELKDIGRAQGEKFQWRMSNVKTWVSAALTDYHTCIDGFADKALNGKVKTSIKVLVGNVAQLTSNALALVNKYESSSKH